MKKRIKYILPVLAAMAVTLCLIAAWAVPLPQRMSVPGARMVQYADGSPMCVFLSEDDKWRIPVRLSDVDEDYIDALIAYEDERFRYHPGVDPLAIVRAAGQNIKEKRIVSGASTITMQLARILDEPRDRTLSAKIVEAVRALQLELLMDKDEVLEAYLTFAPYGSNIEGIEAASLAFFGHPADVLSPFEMAFLVTVPQNPSHRMPGEYEIGEMKEVVARAAKRLHHDGVFSDHDLEQALAGIPPASVESFPRDAMHVANFLLERYEGPRIKSSVRRYTQKTAERALASYKRVHGQHGIHNASAVVIDNESGKVVAAVGNFDFWDDENNGQVVGFDALRSPGSALKPFVYAMGVDRGIVLPGFQVEDVPVRFSGYEPINYDRDFRGLVRMEDALSQSLNIPFVNLVRDVGVDEYTGFLSDGSVSSLSHERGYYGLSIAIGALDVKLWEMTGLFATLARGGVHIDTSWLADEEAGEGGRILSEGASYLTRRALSIKDRPDFPARRSALNIKDRVFWKTGTSAWHRDAWALGSNGKYTAGVWTGNFDGEPSHSLVGSQSSGPVLFDILEALPGAPEEFERVPDDLIKIKVCAWSGRPAGPDCPETRDALALRTHTPVETCPYHRSYTVDADSGKRLPPLCRHGRKIEVKTFTVLPASIRRWMKTMDLNAPVAPPIDESCNRLATRTGRGPRITAPTPESVFFMVPGMHALVQEIPLEAVAPEDVSELLWFVDGRFISKTLSHERAWLPSEPGRHEVRVMDSYGRAHSIHIRVIPPG